MAGGIASATGLDGTLARCQPTRVELSHDYKQLGFARRWWAALLAVAALLLFIGGGIITQVAGGENATDDIIVAAVLLIAGLGLLWYLYAQLVVPWRAQRRSGDAIRSSGVRS